MDTFLAVIECVFTSASGFGMIHLIDAVTLFCLCKVCVLYVPWFLLPVLVLRRVCCLCVAK